MCLAAQFKKFIQYPLMKRPPTWIQGVFNIKKIMISKMYYKDKLFDWEMRDELTDVQGVYFLLSSDSIILYVGRSKNLYSRIKVHRADPDKQFSHVSVLIIEDKRKTELTESAMIKLHKPLYNKQIPATNKSIDDVYEYVQYVNREMSLLSNEVRRLNYENYQDRQRENLNLRILLDEVKELKSNKTQY